MSADEERHLDRHRSPTRALAAAAAARDLRRGRRAGARPRARRGRRPPRAGPATRSAGSPACRRWCSGSPTDGACSSRTGMGTILVAAPDNGLRQLGGTDQDEVSTQGIPLLVPASAAAASARHDHPRQLVRRRRAPATVCWPWGRSATVSLGRRDRRELAALAALADGPVRQALRIGALTEQVQALRREADLHRRSLGSATDDVTSLGLLLEMAVEHVGVRRRLRRGPRGRPARGHRRAQCPRRLRRARSDAGARGPLGGGRRARRAVRRRLPGAAGPRDRRPGGRRRPAGRRAPRGRDRAVLGRRRHARAGLRPAARTRSSTWR